MKPAKTILYLCVILLPALFIGSLTIYLLRHEQERLDQRSRQLLDAQVMSLALGVRDQLETAIGGLLDDLAGLPDGDLPAALARQRKVNPLVRNVFLLDPEAGLVFPTAPGSQEESAFLQRYRRLFDDPEAFLVKREPERSPEIPWNRMEAVAQGDTTRNWTSWFWEDALYLVGWSRRADGQVRGVEIEAMALLSRILPQLPEMIPGAGGLVVRDYAGNLFYQSGEFAVGGTPSVSVPIGRVLPNWQVLGYDEPGARRTSRVFLISMSGLIGLMLLAVLLGGILLVKETRSKMHDALQKTNFVASVSHELKTPLTSIRMYAELLGDGRVADPVKQARYLEVIIAESRRLTRLVNNVLTFSRLERGKNNYNIATLDAGALVTAVVETVQPRAQQAGIDLEIAPDAGPCWVRADGDALEQVLLNLLDNALKYGCRPNAPGKVTVILARSEARVFIRVRDHGPGVPRKYRQKIFGKFFRVDQSLTSPVSGSGLGLSIASLLVADMGGTLSYEEAESGGSCFVIGLRPGEARAGESDKFPDATGEEGVRHGR